MKRRQLFRYAGLGLASALGAASAARLPFASAQGASSLRVRWLGHTCFLFEGSGKRILVNPFQPRGCTAGYSKPAVEVDLVLASSHLLDEGATDVVPGNPQVFAQPGDYRFQGIQIQGVGIPHDEVGGRRLGTNVIWHWEQGGVKIAHLGGAAAPIQTEQRILIGRPDIAFIPVGNTANVYGAQQAQQALETLKPKIAVPTHYRTDAAEDGNCDLDPLESFLQAVEGMDVRRLEADATVVSASTLPAQGPKIWVMRYPS